MTGRGAIPRPGNSGCRNSAPASIVPVIVVMVFPVPPEAVIWAAVRKPPLVLAVVPVARLVWVGAHSALAGRLRAPVRWGGRGPGEGVALLASRQRLGKRRVVSSAVRWGLLPRRSHLDREARGLGQQESPARGARRGGPPLPRRIPTAGAGSAEPTCPPPSSQLRMAGRLLSPQLQPCCESAEVEL